MPLKRPLPILDVQSYLKGLARLGIPRKKGGNVREKEEKTESEIKENGVRVLVR